MQAILFASTTHNHEPLIAGLRSENIFVQVVTPTDDHFKQQLLSGTHFFFFHREVRTHDIPFLELVRTLRPTAITVLIDPIDHNSIDRFDLAFARPYSYPLMSIHLQKKLLEKREMYCPREIRMANFLLHFRRRAMIKDEIIIPLRHKEFSLMQYFFMNDGRIVSRADILEYVWDRNTSLATNTVDVHVSRLRSKLKLLDADHHLQTVPCVGYLWSSDSI